MSLNISIDSRTIISPSDTAFYALTGKNHNGHDYIPELYARGVRDFTVSEWRKEFDTMTDAVFHRTENTLKALQDAAARHRAAISPECEVAGITGSNGKTVVKEWIAQMLADDTDLYRSPRSWNSQIGVPLSLLGIKADCRTAIIEAGISRPGEMEALERMITPSVGIFTHLGDAHGDNFTSPEEKLREKCILFRRSGTVICHEGKTADLIRRYVPDPTRVKSWTVTHCASRNTYILTTPFSSDIELTLPFGDEASVENALTAATYLLYRGFEPDAVRQKIMHLQPVAMRLEIKEGVNRCTLIKDYYNSDPESLGIALQRLKAFSSEAGRGVILSDFVDSGEDYAPVAAELKKSGISLFIGIGPKLSEHRSLFSGIPVIRFYEETESFIRAEERNSFRGMAILLKGARTFHFENVATFLQKRSHTTILEVDLDAMAHNLNCFRALLPKGTMTAVMVKAFTYGAGSTEVASMLQYQGVNYLMVAYSDEGVELRSKGITVPIGVMNPEPESFDDMIEFNLEPEIYSLDMLSSFEESLVRHGEENYPVHIKLNTGMNRSGLDPEEIQELIDFYSLFYLRFISERNQLEQAQWLYLQSTSTYTNWCGLTFERLCFAHTEEIRMILGISGVRTKSLPLYLPDAQMDMVIEQPDKILTLCEMKYTDAPYQMTLKEQQAIEHRAKELSIYNRKRRTVLRVLVTNQPANKNSAYSSCIDKNITIRDIIN